MAERGEARSNKQENGKVIGNDDQDREVKEDLPREEGSNGSEMASYEERPPPLPPRPNAAPPAERPGSSGGASTLPRSATRPTLQSKPTTALSLTGIQTQSYGADEQLTIPTSKNFSHGGFRTGITSRDVSEGDDSTSVMSYVPATETGMDIESMLGDVLGNDSKQQLKLAMPRSPDDREQLFVSDERFEEAFEHEFDELDDITSDGLNEDAVVRQWRSKLKHFLILSSAGKPVWSRHGDDQLITSSIGVIQTIISFYQGVSDSLKGFTAGGVRFVILSKGSLNFVAISRMGESDQQLRVQLEALYMQILSTLTFPVLERMFKTRASTDLRRPLQGTEKLLSALADGFTRGSPSTLLQALECLKLRKSHRTVINNTLLKVKAPDLLYGLIVAGGRLVSVVRPRKHSLHPGDLQLIFNMLFEAGSVRAGGGENWIPLCLPGFNNTGYVYMYVSFLNLSNPKEEVTERPASSEGEDGEVAILLISTNRESFYELRKMRDDLVKQLSKNGSLELIRLAVRRGRPSCTDIVPGSVLRHFLYKSRGNVQFVMPSFEPTFTNAIDRRNVMTLYASHNAALHTKAVHPKIHQSTTEANISLAWSTPVFELYAVAPANTPRAALALAANRVVQWVRREEERIFIIGGAVF